jgi:hypothetical protein
LSSETARSRKPRTKLYWIIGSIIVIAAAVWFIQFDTKGDELTQEINARNAALRAIGAISINFEDFKDYYEMMSAGQRKAYWDRTQGQVVQWTGEIRELGQGKLVINDRNDFFEALLSAKQETQSLAAGQSVTIRGRLYKPATADSLWQINEAVIVANP